MAGKLSQYKITLTTGLTYRNGQNTVFLPYKAGDSVADFALSNFGDSAIILKNGGKVDTSMFVEDTDTFNLAFSSTGITVTWKSQVYSLGDVDDILLVVNMLRTDSGGLSVIATGSTTSRSLADRFAEYYHVMDYDAVGDGVTDDTTAIQAALTAAINSGRPATVYFDDGKQFKTKGGHKLASNITIAGGGMHTARVLYDDTTATQFMFYTDRSPDPRVSNICIRDLRVDGTWLTNQSEMSSDLRPFRFSQVDNLIFMNVQSNNARKLNVTAEYSTNVFVSNCHVQNSCRDAFNFTACSGVTFTGCSVQNCADDAFACHTPDAAPNPVRRGVSILGCTIVDSFGIKCLGGRDITIVGNQIRRPRSYGIIASFSDGTFNEGNTSALAITVTGNTVTDVIDGPVFGPFGVYRTYIQVGSVAATSGGATLANKPGQNDTATSTFVPYHKYLHNKGTGATVPHAGGFGINVSGNTLIRTAATDVANYSDLGWGLPFNKTGYADLALTSADMNATGFRLDRTIKNAIISNNTVSTGLFGVLIAARAGQVAQDFDFENLVIANNNFHRCLSSGITNDFITSDAHVDIKIYNNRFDLDPYHESPNRDTVNKDGTWSVTTQAFPAGLVLTRMKGVKVGGNHYRNCLRPHQLSAGSVVQITQSEIVYCKPVAVGTNDSNGGVGFIPAASPNRWHHVIEETSPASADYGKILNICELGGTAVPTTGTYVAGHMIYNTGPAITLGETVIGWLRLTTGSNHTVGTDWVVVRSQNTLTASFTYNPGNIASGAGEVSGAVTVTGAAFGDAVDVAAPYDLQGIQATGYVSAADTVRIKLSNDTGSAIDLASGSWKIKVRKG